MSLAHLLSMAFDPGRMLAARGLPPDAWQRELLLAPERQILLCCSRQSGKSTVASTLALHTALFYPGSLVLLVSPSLRQSGEIFRKVMEGYQALGRPIAATHETQQRLELASGSRILSLPGREQTIRAFGGVGLLVLDEAARIPDDLYRSVRPMLAVSQGRLLALSTPFGQRGWFWQEWEGPGPWKKVHIPWQKCPRISPEFIAEETRALGELWVQQEYEARFTSMEGLVYPDFTQALVPLQAVPEGRWVGGIDFGWRSPFAAVWGVLDRDDVLWITGERYLRQTPLHEHARALRELGSVVWYADPAGRTEIEELRSANLVVRPADNDIRLGIAAVTARLRTDRLKIHREACPSLITESRLYRYPCHSERAMTGEAPLDRDNHALDALRYLVARVDSHFVARLRGKTAKPAPAPPRQSPGPRLDDESLWTSLM